MRKVEPVEFWSGGLKHFESQGEHIQEPTTNPGPSTPRTVHHAGGKSGYLRTGMGLLGAGLSRDMNAVQSEEWMSYLMNLTKGMPFTENMAQFSISAVGNAAKTFASSVAGKVKEAPSQISASIMDLMMNRGGAAPSRGGI